ncbi:481_t:CDS:2, partial [Cetraspora pellucida]
VYAARVRNLHAYDAISKNVLSRWTFPIVSDGNLQGDNYEFMCGHIYKEKDVLLSRPCSLGEKVLIGAGSEIVENVKITNFVIGRRDTIDGAYIWDDVKIKSNCSVFLLVKNVVLDENVIVKKDVYFLMSDEISYANDDELDVKNIQVVGLAYDISNISLTDSDSPPLVIYNSSDESATEEGSLKEFFKELYFLDVLDEDAILEWNSSDLADNDPSKSNIRKR